MDFVDIYEKYKTVCLRILQKCNCHKNWCSKIWKIIVCMNIWTRLVMWYNSWISKYDEEDGIM